MGVCQGWSQVWQQVGLVAGGFGSRWVCQSWVPGGCVMVGVRFSIKQVGVSGLVPGGCVRAGTRWVCHGWYLVVTSGNTGYWEGKYVVDHLCKGVAKNYLCCYDDGHFTSWNTQIVCCCTNSSRLRLQWGTLPGVSPLLCQQKYGHTMRMQFLWRDYSVTGL